MSTPEAPLASRVDHVIIETADEAALFAFLTETLALPVAWPVAQWGRFREGGASVGNCNLGCNHFRDPDSDPAPTLRRIALEPARPIAAVIDAATRRGLLASEPIVSGRVDVPDVEPYLPWRNGWTVVLLSTELNPSPFLCAYDHDVAARVQSQEAALVAAGGGRLGITGLQEIVIVTDDPTAARAEWHSLLSPGAGPSLRFEEGPSATALVLGVRSIDLAAKALGSLGIGHVDDGRWLRLAPGEAHGLDIRLTGASTR